MTAYERSTPVLPDDPPPVCGRPAGHNGLCRSVAALTRYRAYNMQSWQQRGPRINEIRRINYQRAREAGMTPRQAHAASRGWRSAA